jgi:4-hydroxy-3-methylbut-2-enyl diphosphate reductase
MEVMTATAGWCFGIKRAYQLIEDKALDAEGRSLFAAHRCTSPHANDDLDTLRRIEAGDRRLLQSYPGLGRVTVVHDLSRLGKGDRLLLGYHGLPDDEKASLAARGVSVSDYQCPFIASLNKKVEMLVKDGFNIMFVGKNQNHHCLHAKKLAAENNRECFVIEKLADLESFSGVDGSPWALVGQVTGNTLLWDEVVRWNEKTKEAQVVQPTVCTDSFDRQQEAIELAEKTEVTVLLDDGGAASVSLHETIAPAAKPVYRVRWREDGGWKKAIQESWFADVQAVAVVGGILIPDWAIDEVASYLRGLKRGGAAERRGVDSAASL